MKLKGLKLPKLVHGLIYAAGVLLALCALIIGLASSAWFRSILQHRIEASLAEVTGGEVVITGMKFHPLDLRIDAPQLVVHGLEKGTDHPLFSARDVTTSISAESLLRFQLLLRSLEWQQAELYVRTYPDGSTNIPDATLAPGSGQGLQDLLNLGIEHLTLSHTSLHWNNQRFPFQMDGRNVAIQLHISPDRHYQGTIASSDAVICWGNRTLPHLSFATTFKLYSQHVQVSGLSWQIENLRGHFAGDFRWMPQLAGNFEFRANGGLQELSRTLRITPIEKGYLYVDGKGTYDAEGFSAKGRVRARDLKLKTPEARPGSLNLTGDYEFARSRLRIPNFTLAVLKARAQGDATLSLAMRHPEVVVHSQFQHLDLSALMQAVPGIASAIGILHPQALMSGLLNATWRRPSRLESQFDVQFAPPEASAQPGVPITGRSQGTLELGRQALITLQDAEISTPHSHLAARGSFGDIRSSMTVKFVTSDFGELHSVADVLIQTRNPLPVTLHSQAVFTGNISGSFSNPEFEGQLSTGKINYGGWLWDSFQAGIMISPQETRIQSGRLTLGNSLLTLNADIGLAGWKVEQHSKVRLHVTAHETPIAGLRAALNIKPPMDGLVTGQVQAEGTVDSLSGSGQISIHQGDFDGIPFDSLTANILATESNWTIRDFKVVEGRGRASGSMQVNPVQHTFSANVQGRDFPLSRIYFLNPQKPDSKVSGLVSFDLKGGGAFDNAQLHSSIDVTQLAWKGQPLGSIHGQADWQGNQVRFQIQGGGGQAGHFQLTGNLATGDTWPLHLSGEYAGWRVDPWIEEFSGHAIAAEISATGSFSVEGPFKDKSKLVGRSQIQQLHIDFPSLKLSNEVPVEATYADYALNLKRFRLQGSSTNFEVGGSVNFGHPPTLDISANGRAAAPLLSLLASGLQATGESDLKMRIQGSLAEPQMSGEIQVKDVSLGYNDLPFRLNALNGTIKLEGERAVISSLKGTIGGGNVNLAGFLVLQDTPRYQIRVDLSQVRVRYPTDFTSVLGGSLTMAGTTAQGQISGNIDVRNIFANENLNLVDILSGPNLFGGPSVSRPSNFASGINVNVNLASSRPVRIETHNLSLVSDIDLHVQGTLANPVAVGNIYLRSGNAVFRGNRYTLTRGDIAMTNPFRTEPVLDLQVRTRIEKYDLTLEISGPIDQVRLSYRSDPPLPTADILSLLAFGYSRRLQEFAPEAKNPFSSAGANALLSSALSNQVTGRIQRLFGVSRIKFSPSSTELGTLGGPVLTVEQQLSPDLTLTYETTTASSQYRVVEFEYTVNPRMSVRGFRDQNGIFGLELKFRKRFK